MIIFKRLSMIIFFVLLVVLSYAVSTEPVATASSSQLNDHVSAGSYFAGIIGILLSIGLGYGLKKIYDVSRKNS